MRRHKSTPSKSVKKYINTPDQKEKDKHPQINPEGTEIYNRNDREFKIATKKKKKKKNSSYKRTQNDSSMKSGTKLMNRGNSSQKRMKL